MPIDSATVRPVILKKKSCVSVASPIIKLETHLKKASSVSVAHYSHTHSENYFESLLLKLLLQSFVFHDLLW